MGGNERAATKGHNRATGSGPSLVLPLVSALFLKQLIKVVSEFCPAGEFRCF